MTPIDYLLIGHVTADIIPNGRTLGGTVSYSAPVAAMFGHRVGMVTSTAPNESLIDPLHEIATLKVLSADSTTTFENIYKNRQRTQYVHGFAKSLSYDDIPQEWRTAPLVHLAPLVNEVDLTIPEQYPDATVLLTPQGLLRKWDDTGLVRFKRWLDVDALKHIDIVVFSKQDILDAPELEQEFAAVGNHVVVTDGENGGTYYNKGEAIPYAAYPVEEIDPTGAGDVFAAALLSSLLTFKGNMTKALQVAARLAAQTVTRKGASPAFNTEDVQQILKDIHDD